MGKKIIRVAFPLRDTRTSDTASRKLDGSLGRIGSLEVRLTSCRKGVRKAQRADKWRLPAHILTPSYEAQTAVCRVGGCA